MKQKLWGALGSLGTWYGMAYGIRYNLLVEYQLEFWQMGLWLYRLYTIRTCSRSAADCRGREQGAISH